MDNPIFYYTNELEDEFSSAQIEPIKIDKNYPYMHHLVWDFSSAILQNVLSMPLKVIYAKLKFHHKIIGREKFKRGNNTGYFIYVNHTQEFADTFLPSLATYPKRNFFVVNPENVSMKGLKKLVPLLGAIPVPGDLTSSKNFINCLQNHLIQKHSITIYPEAHIWPYYTKIRNFKEVSFQYPILFQVPFYTITNTYQQGKIEGNVKIISYIDGPFYPNENLPKKVAQKHLRDLAYDTMVERSRQSSYEHIIYRKRE